MSTQVLILIALLVVATVVTVIAGVLPASTFSSLVTALLAWLLPSPITTKKAD